MGEPGAQEVSIHYTHPKDAAAQAFYAAFYDDGQPNQRKFIDHIKPWLTSESSSETAVAISELDFTVKAKEEFTPEVFTDTRAKSGRLKVSQIKGVPFGSFGFVALDHALRFAPSEQTVSGSRVHLVYYPHFDRNQSERPNKISVVRMRDDQFDLLRQTMDAYKTNQGKSGKWNLLDQLKKFTHLHRIN